MFTEVADPKIGKLYFPILYYFLKATHLLKCTQYSSDLFTEAKKFFHSYNYRMPFSSMWEYIYLQEQEAMLLPLLKATHLLKSSLNASLLPRQVFLDLSGFHILIFFHYFVGNALIFFIMCVCVCAHILYIPFPNRSQAPVF